MKLNNIQSTEGSRKDRKRVGCGIGSGTGKTAGRGHKGQKSRTGGKVARGFEGGQMPLIRRVPKRGFTSKVKNAFQVVNLSQLNAFDDGIKVDAAALYDAGLVRNAVDPIKVLGNGELSKKVELAVDAVSSSAASKIQAAGAKLTLTSAEA